MATAALLNSLAIPLSDAEALVLQELSSDFRFLLSEFDVPDKVQIRIHTLRYRNLKTFTVIADDRAGVRAAIAADIVDGAEANLTPDQVASARVISAQILAAWVSAGTKGLEETRAAAENKVMRLPALVTRAGLIAFRQRFEREHGRQNDATWPCASLIEKRLEEVEEGTFTAQALSEIISVEAAGDEIVDITEYGSGLKLRKAPKSISLPTTTEQFRTRMKCLAISYIIAGYKHSSRLWLRTATLPVFLAYTEYILSDSVAGYHLDQEGVNVRASWLTTLTYELNVRKLVARMVLYEDLDFSAALTRAMADIACKERFFITPTALITASRGKQSNARSSNDDPFGESETPSKGLSAAAKRRARKGGGKGVIKTSGKGGKTAAKGKAGGKSQMQKTPDGRLICGFVNLPQGCVKPKCQFLHVCNLCYDPDHVAAQCPKP